MFEDTIIAISTPLGYGGLGVVRLSGPRALALSLEIFSPRTRRRTIPPRQPVLGLLRDPGTGEAFEEAMLTYFPGPRSYTTEDVVEISSHGSPVIQEEAVRLGCEAGARLAAPGEFTLRAFLGGRIDILQAEAVNDLIQAASLSQARISYRQLDGSLSRRVSELRRRIIHILSQIEARIEFPDEGLQTSPKVIARGIQRALGTVTRLAESYDLGKTLREGIVLAVTGRTNSGKSTLFNRLLGDDRSIVTPFPGTTRDYIREQMKIEDAVFSLIDTAGLDNAPQPIEKEGIRRGKALAARADGILLLLDTSRPENEDDLALVRKYRDKRTMLLWNKTDLPRKIRSERIREAAGGLPQLEISALRGTNLPALREEILRLFVPDRGGGDEVILHMRQKLVLDRMRKALQSALSVLEQGHSEEVLAEEVRPVLPLIGQLTGEIRVEDVLEDIFDRFCVGK
jgi:tRNA modification GTPase